MSRELPSLKDMVSAGDPCLFRDSRSACSSSRRTTITLYRRKKNPVRKSFSHLRILSLNQVKNLRCRAEKRRQALRVKVNFTAGFVWCFPRQVWIWQKKKSFTKDATLAPSSQRKRTVPTATGSTVLRRMLGPPLADLRLLCLGVSVHVVLVTLDVSLTRTHPHFIYALLLQLNHLKCSPVWCLRSQSF